MTLIALDTGITGTGLVLTMGRGNDLVCRAIELLGQQLQGYDLWSARRCLYQPE